MAPADNIALANDLTPLEALGPGDSHDSGIEDSGSVASSTQSLTDSILEHVYENGRRYHRKSQGKYALPSDETEQDRLDLTHAFFLELLDGKLNLSPLKGDPQNVLDCGTGTGIWALDFGDHHQGSNVIGVDLAPIQPSWVAPNVRFELDDLEKDWTYPLNHFDLIHSRTVGTGIKNWPRYLSQMYAHTKPGGYVEIAEHALCDLYCDDNTMPEDSAYRRYMHLLGSCLKAMGVDSDINNKKLQRMIEDAGFVDVQCYVFKLPLGPWAKNKKSRRLGAIMGEIVSSGFEAYGRALMTSFGKMSDSEATEMINECLDVLRKCREHGYNLHWQLVARKPE